MSHKASRWDHSKDYNKDYKKWYKKGVPEEELEDFEEEK
jgi:hypothetical protein